MAFSAALLTLSPMPASLFGRLLKVLWKTRKYSLPASSCALSRTVSCITERSATLRASSRACNSSGRRSSSCGSVMAYLCRSPSTGGGLNILNKPFGVLALLGEALPGGGHHHQNGFGLRRICGLGRPEAILRKLAVLTDTRHRHVPVPSPKRVREQMVPGRPPSALVPARWPWGEGPVPSRPRRRGQGAPALGLLHAGL